ncbi:hypothetical protein DL764_007271 [Monosporascus ibericus]|uniref:O-methylsterigmatocystin oxidoreductase n=1 Tax=Monosporascus ibericus TaxID=155417 RepID=A0A4Q4T485_9PEZI|nr:hypothetical protein DL764_007271 [Monosporascus ibericus]
MLLGSKKSKAPLPPGPKPLPLVGNLADLPPKGAREWEHWIKHKDLYGPISSVTAFGTTIVLLHDAKFAVELLEKRGNIHSSRPRMIFANEMCGWVNFLASQPYGNRFRAFRQRFHRFMGTRAALSGFYDLQELEAHRLLLRVLRAPDRLLDHVRTEAGAIILKMAYGYTVEPHKEDPLVSIADKGLSQFSAAFVPGAWLVDTIPILRYLPDWMPGAAFKRTAREWYATVTEIVENPMRFVKRNMEAGKYEPSYVSALYEKAGDKMTAEDEYVTKWSAASLYTGGADTTVKTVQTFFLAMMMYPDVQRKAQEEIDRVVGSQRLPCFEDRDHLPYVEAVVSEALRWHPVAPMGLPHVTTQDDVFEGYLIPKGAMIVPNIWYFTHDPAVYKDPMSFNPDRFLADSPAPNPRNYVFGFGRRICPGRLLADSSVWITIAKSLAVFNIRKPVVDGKEVEPTVLFTPGVISHSYPYTAMVEPRSPKHADLIRAVERDHPWEQSSSASLHSVKA